MAKNDPLANLDKTPKSLGSDIPGGLPGSITPVSVEQANDLHDHLVRLQKQVNEQGALIEDLQTVILSLQEKVPDTPLQLGTYETKVWETVLVGALSAALGPNKVIQDTPKAMQQILGKAIRLAENGVIAARDYQLEQQRNRQVAETAKNNDPLKQLLI
jgi:hypothetical protein